MRNNRIISIAQSIRTYFENAIRDGILWIFGSSVFSQLCTFISSVVVIRHLSKANYGYYVDASNIYNYTAAFIGMGMTSAVIQFCSEKRSEDETNSIYLYSIIKGLRFNIVLAAIILALAYCKSLDGHNNAAVYLAYMCLLPMVSYTNQFVQVVLRVKRANNYFGLVNIGYSLSIVAGNIVLTHLWGVSGLVVSGYISNAIASVIGILLLNRNYFLKELHSSSRILSRHTTHEIDKYALLCAVTNLSSSVLVLLDITCISAIVESSEVLAEYKVGSAIPSACMFIPTCLITFYYPVIVEHFSEGVIPFIDYLKKIITVFLLVSTLIALVLFVFSSPIIKLVYGQQYLSSAGVMRILSVNFLLSAGIVKLFGNLIAILKKVSINLYISIFSGLVNIALDVYLIKMMGQEGAAIATLIVTIIIAILEGAFIYYYLNNLLRQETQYDQRNI